jgi:Tetratricopeptide repeat
MPYTHFSQPSPSTGRRCSADTQSAQSARRERVSGPEHPATLTARANLARWTGQAGDAAAARDQYATLLPAVERVSGPEHPDTLAARANLAHWTGQAERGPGGA